MHYSIVVCVYMYILFTYAHCIDVPTDLVQMIATTARFSRHDTRVCKTNCGNMETRRGEVAPTSTSHGCMMMHTGIIV